MIVCIDTNTVVQALATRHAFFPILDDPDDNVFSDCAIAAGADFVITEDRHFAPLAGAGYQPQPISPKEFIARHPAICPGR